MHECGPPLHRYGHHLEIALAQILFGGEEFCISSGAFRSSGWTPAASNLRLKRNIFRGIYAIAFAVHCGSQSRHVMQSRSGQRLCPVRSRIHLSGGWSFNRCNSESVSRPGPIRRHYGPDGLRDMPRNGVNLMLIGNGNIIGVLCDPTSHATYGA